MLLSITNDILEQNNITNIWHRQSILFAVAKLREASDQLSNGRAENMGEVLQHTTPYAHFLLDLPFHLEQLLHAGTLQFTHKLQSFDFVITGHRL